MVPVYTVTPQTLNPQIYQCPYPVEQQGNYPQNIVFQPIQGTPVTLQTYIPSTVSVITSGSDQYPQSSYTHNVICYVVIYLIFFAGCIGVQFGLYGSKTAAALWITSYLLLLATVAAFFIIRHRTLTLLLLIQLSLLILSFAFEVAAFAMAISHPVLYNYQTDVSESVYNNRRLQQDYYNQDTCIQLYKYSSYSDYYNYYSQYCDSILGYQALGTSEYQTCRSLYDYSSLQVYEIYYKSYCDNILGYSSGNGYYYSDSQFCHEAHNYYDQNTYRDYFAFFCDSILGNVDAQYNLQQSDNQCIREGYYNPYREYCYPLQYGMMAYAVANLVAYLILFGVLLKRIIVYFKLIKANQKTTQEQPIPQEQPLISNKQHQEY